MKGFVLYLLRALPFYFMGVLLTYFGVDVFGWQYWAWSVAFVVTVIAREAAEGRK